MTLSKIKNLHKLTFTGLCLNVLMWTDAVATSNTTIGTMASSITSTFSSVGKLITAGSYIAGLASVLTAIFKFRQWKDNPAQVQIGTPITFLMIGAALLFLPSVLDVAGNTLFGTGGGSVAGPSGIDYQ